MELLWSTVSPEEKVLANISARCYLTHIETEGCAISARRDDKNAEGVVQIWPQIYPAQWN
jgi:hypothetical protein